MSAPINAHPLDPPLPFEMKPRARVASRDLQLQQFVNSATRGKDRGRVSTCEDAFGENYDEVRRLAGRIKQHTLDHLDRYIEQFVDRAESNGMTVHFAADGEQANAICLDIAKRNGSRLCVKSKSMVTEETGIVPLLEDAGIETLETDLGEFILQLDHDAPSHIVTPMIHKDRRSVARAFVRELDAEYTEDPETLTRIAREHMRDKYKHADLGMSGGNFLVAESGSLVICTNEGNADFSVSAPRVHVAFVGIEKLVPCLEHLSVFLKLLARSATSQPLTIYTTMISGPRRAHELDGPDEVHIILIDNGRTKLLRDESRELLRCIRCGACLNACPVFRKVGGGHAYGAVYSGPIGAVITPIFKGLENYGELPHASSLCGACFEACPVHIDIPKHLIRLRAQTVEERIVPAGARLAYRTWSRFLESPLRYAFAVGLSRVVLRALGRTSPGSAPLSDRGWTDDLPGPLAAWTNVRSFPTPPSQTFRQWWKENRQNSEHGEGRSS